MVFFKGNAFIGITAIEKFEHPRVDFLVAWTTAKSTRYNRMERLKADLSDQI